MTLYMPSRNDEIELINAVNIAYRAFGRALGELYDAKLRPLNAEWFTDLQRERRKVLSLHDPYFVIDEPLRNPGSVTRACFGRIERDFWEAMEKARFARNQWVHAEVKATPRTAIDAVRPIAKITQSLRLDVSGELAELLERVQAITAGNTFEADIDEARIAELVAEIEAEQAAREQALDDAAQAFVKANEIYGEKQELAAQTVDLQARLDELEISLSVAMEGWGRAVAIAEENAQRQAAEHQAEVDRMRELVPEPLADVVLPPGLKPGDPWPEELAIGGWDLDLKAGLGDFLVLGTPDTLSELLPDEDVTAFARGCLDVIPIGGLVYVDHCGHVVRSGYPDFLDQTYVGTMPRHWTTASPVLRA
jgi:hypothetical protein